MDHTHCNGCMRPKQSHPVCEHCGYDERQQNKSHQLPVGTVLHGQYQVGRVLGQGGFGITYIGMDRLLKTRIAIKELYPKTAVVRDCRYSTLVSSQDQDKDGSFLRSAKARFLLEAQTLAKLNGIHEIVSVRSFFEENNTAYIVMEYVQGTELKHYVQERGGRLSAEETLRILQPVIRALSAVHREKLVHRDISPDNIMLLPDNRIKLLDFGAAKIVEHADVNSSLQQSTIAIVKRGYAPMEQYQSRGSLGSWSDVYALCATAYFCLSGEVPPEAPLRISDNVHPDWSRIPGLTQQQRRTLEMGMAVRAGDRLANVEELYHGLYSGGYQEAPVVQEIRCPVCDMSIRSGMICPQCGHDMGKMNHPDQLPVGTALNGKYRVGLIMGGTSFDYTYAGWDCWARRPVVLKEFVIHRLMRRDNRHGLHTMKDREYVEQTKELFRQTGRDLIGLHSVSEINQIYDVFDANGTAYMAVEFVFGKSLKQYVLDRGGKLSASEAISLMRPLVKALIDVHAANEVHMDICPENIKVLPDNRLKLIDFRYALEPNTEEAYPTTASQKVNRFQSLEIYQTKGVVSAQMDVYSLCATLYFCMTGREPQDVRMRLVEEEVSWGAIPGLQPGQRKALEKGMEPLPKNRTAFMADLYDGLYNPTSRNQENRCPVCGRPKNSGQRCSHCGHEYSSPDNPLGLSVGTVLKDRYRVGKLEGYNSRLSIAHKAWDIERDKPVLLEKFDPDYYISWYVGGKLKEHSKEIAELRLRFRNMAQGLARLAHTPGIIEVYDWFDDNDTSYMVTEIVQGKPLDELNWNRADNLRVRELLRIMEPLMRALKKVHDEGILHGDINPEHIIVEPNGSAKLIGFSVERNIWVNHRSWTTDEVFYSAYDPIEQFSPLGILGPWSDVYSLCATIYKIVAKTQLEDVIYRHTYGDAIDWSHIPGLTPQQQNTLEKGLAINAKDRISSMEELYNGLYAVFQQSYTTSALEQIIYCPVCGNIRKEYPQCEHCGYDETKKNKNWHLPAGTMLMRCYRIGNTAYEHGFQIGYWGWDVQQSRRVMIKECFPVALVKRVSANSMMVTGKDAACNREFMQERATFLQEADSMLKWSAIPGVQNVYSKFETNGTAYLVLEPLLHGETLDQYVRNNGGKLTAHKTLELFEPLIKTFAMVSKSRHFVHASICPDRIVVQNYDTLRLFNFGNECVGSDAPLFQNGYTPLEAYNTFRDLKPSTDIYAICATMYFCMTGKRPPSPEKRIMAMQQIDWVSIEGLTQKQIKTFEKGTAIRVQNRFTNMRELYDGLYLKY